MDLWMDLLFGNPIGLLSMVTVFGTIIILAYLLVMFYRRSRR